VAAQHLDGLAEGGVTAGNELAACSGREAAAMRHRSRSLASMSQVACRRAGCEDGQRLTEAGQIVASAILPVTPPDSR